MDEKIYSVTLSDGTVIDGLRMNGNNFISKDPIDPEMFEGNLAVVVINDGETEETRENMELVQVTRMGEEYWFVLRDVPASEIANAKLRSDLDYLAMMADVEI